MTGKPRQVLCELIAKYGQSLADDRSRCSGLLRDLCGSHKAEIAVLLDAQEEGVPSALRTGIASGSAQELVSRLSKSLEKDRHLTEKAARWAVESWALALGISNADEQDDPLPEPPPKKSTQWPITMIIMAVILTTWHTIKRNEAEQTWRALELVTNPPSERIRREIEQIQREAEERQKQAEAQAAEQAAAQAGQSSAMEPSDTVGEPFVITADWGSQIQAYASKEACPDAELSEQGYVYELFVTIPVSRIKNPSEEAWKVSENRAVTVIGCWFLKADGLPHAKMKRKKDGRTWEDDLNFNDGSWKRIQ